MERRDKVLSVEGGAWLRKKGDGAEGGDNVATRSIGRRGMGEARAGE